MDIDRRRAFAQFHPLAAECGSTAKLAATAAARRHLYRVQPRECPEQERLPNAAGASYEDYVARAEVEVDVSEDHTAVYDASEAAHLEVDFHPTEMVVWEAAA